MCVCFLSFRTFSAGHPSVRIRRQLPTTSVFAIRLWLLFVTSPKMQLFRNSRISMRTNSNRRSLLGGVVGSRAISRHWFVTATPTDHTAWQLVGALLRQLTVGFLALLLLWDHLLLLWSTLNRSAWRRCTPGTAKLQHVPVKHIIVGESLVVEQCTE